MPLRTELERSNLVAGHKHHGPDGAPHDSCQKPAREWRHAGIRFPPESKRTILSLHLCLPPVSLW